MHVEDRARDLRSKIIQGMFLQNLHLLCRLTMRIFQSERINSELLVVHPIFTIPDPLDFSSNIQSHIFPFHAVYPFPGLYLLIEFLNSDDVKSMSSPRTSVFRLMRISLSKRSKMCVEDTSVREGTISRADCFPIGWNDDIENLRSYSKHNRGGRSRRDWR